MADISTELQAIQEAVYGEEVRGAIVDALTAMNGQDETARGWAIGPNGTGSQPTNFNNAQYWAEQAAESAAALDLDTTLSVSGKAADAAAVGVSDEWLDGTIQSVTEPTKNLFDKDLAHKQKPALTFLNGVFSGTASDYSGFHLMYGNIDATKTYTVSLKRKTTGTATSTGLGIFLSNESGTLLASWSVSNSAGAYSDYTQTINMASYTAPYRLSFGVRNSNDTVYDIKDVQVEESSSATGYVEHYTAVDAEARASRDLTATGDTTDRASEISSRLSGRGVCNLGAGDFYLGSTIVMPDGSTLRGCGDKTRIHYTGDYGAAVQMGLECSVEDVSFIGASSAITQNGDILGIPTENQTATNVWADGDVSVSSEYGSKHLVFQTPIPAGTYRFTAEITSTDTDSTLSYIGFSRSQTTSIGTSSIFSELSLSRGSRVSGFVVLTETAYSARILAGNTLSGSSGDTATWANIRMTACGGKSGILWKGTSGDSYRSSGTIHNCRFKWFDCAGIIAQDTGTPTRRNLLISDCAFWENNCGIYFRKDAEFNRVTNCTASKNYFGTLNRGGNNYFSNCGFDANWVNAQIDRDEGSNNAHGGFSCCSFHHGHDATHDNQGGYGLVIKGTGNTPFTGCQIGWDKILLENTSGNVFSGCKIGSNVDLTISGGGYNVFSGCTFSTAATVTVTDNTATKISGCYNSDGTEFTLPE